MIVMVVRPYRSASTPAQTHPMPPIPITANAATAAPAVMRAAEPDAGEGVEVIDIHQHINYSGRLNDALVKHQRTMGVSKTVLLPARRSTRPNRRFRNS